MTYSTVAAKDLTFYTVKTLAPQRTPKSKLDVTTTAAIKTRNEGKTTYYFGILDDEKCNCSLCKMLGPFKPKSKSEESLSS